FLDRSAAAPDFVCAGLMGELAVEAVTVGPTREGGTIVPPPSTETDEDRLQYLRDYMTIKFGSALYSKLQKAYWTLPNVAGKPFVLAISDFSSPRSMTHTRSALENYLYGYMHEPAYDADGKLKIVPRKIEKHQWGAKVIPSGFFDQPGAENVSAVLFSN